jgi:hypothetical protein
MTRRTRRPHTSLSSPGYIYRHPGHCITSALVIQSAEAIPPQVA